MTGRLFGAPAAALVGIALLLSGCGSSKSTTSTTSSSTQPTTPSGHAAASRQLPVVSAPAGAGKPSPASLARLPRIAGGGIRPHLGGLGRLSLVQQVIVLDDDLSRFWSGLFAQARLRWPQTTEVRVDFPARTTCPRQPVVRPSDPPYACNTTIYWTLPFMRRAWSPYGNVVVAFQVAIMWSFVVQNTLGFSDALQSGRMPKAAFARQTMCLTGLWVKSVNDRRLFEHGDAQAALDFLHGVAVINHIGPPDVTNRALTRAFLIGFQTGQPGRCTR